MCTPGVRLPKSGTPKMPVEVSTKKAASPPCEAIVSVLATKSTATTVPRPDRRGDAGPTDTSLVSAIVLVESVWQTAATANTHITTVDWAILAQSTDETVLFIVADCLSGAQTTDVKQKQALCHIGDPGCRIPAQIGGAK